MNPPGKAKARPHEGDGPVRSGETASPTVAPTADRRRKRRTISLPPMLELEDLTVALRAHGEELLVDHIVLGGALIDLAAQLEQPPSPDECPRCHYAPAPEVVDEMEAGWAAVAERRRQRLAERDAYVNAFEREWLRHQYASGRDKTKHYPMPQRYSASIRALHTAGLPLAELLDAIDITMNAEPGPVYPTRYFKYCMGCAWNKVGEIRAAVIEQPGTGGSS